ncbi:actin cytoskeleton-regulatory complex protein PAN1-like [Branchiostoma floridae]|uniref:Actin cytoskeleton-regulatory complex protein PAN1-like n=1 Tax=Branchiostoma floridae TaxID=7739 RepID=C3ZCJ6_BRAFL|nr:actin cytoskeleton-regulatory complex protein PAN1-like [Branchiostoma floridae]|eukprot:XP_002593689.1 hypothetical protein BRAFLDRAFT_131794 [Branchiostoma floridae]
MIRSMGGSLEAEFEKQKAQRRRQEHKNMEDQMRKNRIDRVFLDKEYTHVEWMRRRNLHEYDLAQEKIIDQLARIYARQCQIAEEKLAKKEEEERKKRLRIEQRVTKEKGKTKRAKTADSGRSRRSQLTQQFSRTSLVRPATSSFPRSQGPAERAQTPMSEPHVARRGSLSKAMPPRSQSRVSFAQPHAHRTAWGDDDSDRISEISDVSSSSDETHRSPPMKVEVRSLATTTTPAQKGGKNSNVAPSVPPATNISQPNPFQKKRLVTPPTILVLHQKLDIFDDKNQKGSMNRLSPAEQDFIRKKYRQKHECLMQERQRRLKARAQSAPPAQQVERSRYGSISRIEELNLKSSSEKPWVEYWREKLLN